MASTVFPAAAAGKTREVETLTSGSSYTVPTGVFYVNVTLVGGGGGGGGCDSVNAAQGAVGSGGEFVQSTLATTPGASISYGVGAGGAAGAAGNNSGGAGGTTSFTGATSALGGAGGSGAQSAGKAGSNYAAVNNGGQAANGSGIASNAGGAGGSGVIYVEYWV
jgi:hypothetical protein